MLALTILHPWPWAICYMGKDLENRGWTPSPTQLYPGTRFAIHAGKIASVTAIHRSFVAMDAMGCIDHQHMKLPDMADLRRQESSIVAVATYGGAVIKSESKWFAGPGCYGWLLQDLVVLPEPVWCKGAQGLWRMPAAVEAQVLAQLSEAA